MKIAIVTTVHDIRDPRVSLKTAGALARSGYQVDLIGGLSAQSDLPAARQFTQILPDGINAVFLQANDGKFRRIKRQKEVLQRLDLEQTRLLYIHDPELIPLAEWIRFRHNIPYVFDLHEDVFDRKSLRLELLQRIVSWAFKSADGIITAFDPKLRPYHPQPKAPCINVFNFYAPDLIPPENHLSKQLPAKKASIRCCYTGTIAPDRNITDLFRFVDRLISSGLDLELVVAGKIFMPRYLEEIRTALLKCHHKSRLYLIGGDHYVEWPMLEQIHQKSDVGIIWFDPEALNWNYPTKLFEYLGNGLPVISSDIPIIRLKLDELNAGLYLPHDDYKTSFETIHHQIKELVNRDMAPAQDWVKQYANWATEEKKLTDFIQQVL